jgi:hypothetical protein
MHVEIQDTCLGNAPREKKKEVKLTFRKQKRYVEAEGTEDGRSLMMKKVIIKPEPKIENPMQRNNLFRTTYKTKYIVCKVIIDNGSTDNLLSTEMGEKLELETTTHLSLYKVSLLQMLAPEVTPGLQAGVSLIPISFICHDN